MCLCFDCVASCAGGGQFYQMQANGMTIGSRCAIDAAAVWSVFQLWCSCVNLRTVYLDESQVIIDSGTNILLLPDESYSR